MFSRYQTGNMKEELQKAKTIAEFWRENAEQSQNELDEVWAEMEEMKEKRSESLLPH